MPCMKVEVSYRVEVENNSVQWSQIQRRITKNELKKEGLRCFEKCASVWQSYQKQQKTENKQTDQKLKQRKISLRERLTS